MRVCTLTALLLALPLAAAEPTIVTVEQKGSALVVPVHRTEYQTVVKTITRLVNGTPVTQTIAEKVPVTVTRYLTLDEKAGDYFDPAGKPIDPKKLGDVLKKGAVVAVSPDGKPVDPDKLKGKDVAAVLVPKAPAEPKAADPAPKDKPAEKKPAEKDGAGDDKPFATKAWVDEGVITLTRQIITYQQQLREEVRKAPDGTNVVVKVAVMVPVVTEVALKIDPKTTVVQTPDGNAVDPADWAKLLKEKPKVIVSPTGKEVPEEFRKAHKDAAAVIYMQKPK